MKHQLEEGLIYYFHLDKLKNRENPNSTFIQIKCGADHAGHLDPLLLHT